MAGLGVMLGLLSGNEATVEAIKAANGRAIKSVRIDEEKHEDGALLFEFDDVSKLDIFDSGRSCCESRYMTTDDDLDSFAGARFIDCEVADGPETEDKYGDVHEMQFLKVRTDLGVITAETHNEHNGYYGGFWLKVELTEPTQNTNTPGGEHD